MQTVVIEWFHLEVAGATCQRCGETGEELRRAVAQLRGECAAKGVAIVFQETLLGVDEIDRSNTILVNGVPLEEILPQTMVATSCCQTCGDLTGRQEQCRVLVRLEGVYETIPQGLIRQAVCRVAGCC